MALNNAASLANLTATAFDLMAHKPLRSKLRFHQITCKRSTKQSHNGAKVQFPFLGDIGENITPLAEQADGTPSSIAQSYVEIGMAEYGDRAGTTKLLRGTSMIVLDPEVADRVGRAAGASYDKLVEAALAAGANQTDITALAVKTATSSLVRQTQTRLQARDAEPISGEAYVLFSHPDVILDIREEDDAAGLRTFQNGQPSEHANVIKGAVTEYEGFLIVPTNRVTTSGAGATKVYNSYAVGQEAIGKAYPIAPGFTEFPRIEPGPIVDPYKRFVEMTWYWLGGFDQFREEALQVLKTRASING